MFIQLKCSMYGIPLRAFFVSMLAFGFGVSTALAQETEDTDPLYGNYQFGEAAEVLMVWADPGNRSQQKVYDFLNLNNPDPNIPDELQPAERQTVDGDQGAYGDENMDAITADFDGDAMTDFVAAWEGPDRSINLMLPQINRRQLDWDNANAQQVAPPGSLVEEFNSRSGRHLALAPIALDADAEKEFILAYWAADGTITLRLFDTDASLQPTEILNFSDADLSMPLGNNGTEARSTHFDIKTGDLDSDGTDEIIIAHGDILECSRSQGCWQLRLRVYDVDATSGTIAQRAERVLATKEDNSTEWIYNVGVAAGQFDADYQDEIAVSYEHTNNSSQSRWYLQTFKPILALGPEFTALPADQWGTANDTSRVESAQDDMESIHSSTGSTGFPLTMAAADFDLDGKDELVMAYRQLQVYEIQEELQFNRVAGGGDYDSDNINRTTRRVMALADVDADNDLANNSNEWRPEIVTVQYETISDDGGISVDGQYQIAVHRVTPGTFNIETLATLEDERADPSGLRPFAVAAGNFGDKGVRVGKPRRYRRTNIQRPLVILNAPPTHFDVFDGSSFDISQCYLTGGCDFESTYSTSTERTIEVETELKTDWSTSVEASGGFEIPIIEVGVDVSIKTTYGEGFKKVNRNRETFKVSQAVSAVRDDWIYAMIVNYDIWEYPLYINGEPSGHLAVVIPKLNTRAWFDSKSWNALDYIPAHEVGNILSYQPIAAPEENAYLAEAVRWNTGDQITVSGSSDLSWRLTSENETETTTENEVSFKLGGSVDLDIPIPFIPDFELEGDYSRQDVNTQSLRVRDRKGLSVDLGAIDLTVGNTRYDVTPYAYWATNGALVLDYAVSPELAAPGFEDTWWQRRYGTQPDPAFILPWRYDPEKGADISEAQRQQTREIVFNPATPEAGSVVTIQARIHNWSLLPTTRPIDVRFYLGDPNDGGVPIVGVNGETEVSAGQLIDRGSSIVEMQWEIPTVLPTAFPRIYAVIDPEDAETEIHETNNIGWTVMPVEDVIIGTDAEDDRIAELPREVQLLPNYPNPFNPTTQISYTLPQAGPVTLRVFNALGRQITALEDAERRAGTHTITFNAAHIPSGVYFYQLEAGTTTKTRKMLLLK